MNAMLYRLAADLLVVSHLGFVVFVVLGGLLVHWRRWIAWLHIPACIWGAMVEFMGWICPLTPLEFRLRRLGGEEGHTGGFVEHYLLPILYPGQLTREIQIGLGVLVVGVNLILYGWLVLQWTRMTSEPAGSKPESR